MRTSTILLGVLGGVALAAALAGPLYVALPGRYLADWSYLETQPALLLLMISLLAPVAAGALAALFWPDEPVRTGAGAGLLVAIMGSLLMVLPAAAVESSSEVTILVMSRVEEAQLRAAVARAIVSATWLPMAASLAVIAVGPALGAVGGVCYDLAMGGPGNPTRQVHISATPLVALAMGTVVAGVHFAGMNYLDTQILVRLGHPPTPLDQVKMSAGGGALGLCCAILMAWAMRDAVLMFGGERRMRAFLWVVLATALPLAMLGEAVALHPASIFSPITWIAVVTCLAAAATSAFLTSRADIELDPEPRHFGHLTSESILGGLVLVAQALLAGGSTAVGITLMLWPYVTALIGGSALPDLTAEWLVSSVFRVHWAAGAGIFLLAGGWLCVNVPLWIIRRTVKPREY
ncbi:MAG: hypothetical protein KTR31_30070 [Myxococcales bacterium]|nr:hypothetical protein [Myxococcales bacterium]